MAPEDLREIERQNTITAQILENFLERRLFPNKQPTHRLPTLDDILPRTTTTERPTPPPWLQDRRNRLRNASAAESDMVDMTEPDSEETFNDDGSYEDEIDGDDGGGLGSDEDQDYNYRDPESLQSVESEHVDRYLESFRRRTEGRSITNLDGI